MIRARLALLAAGIAALAAPAAAQQPALGETFRDCADCPQMTVVPAGTFQMGAPDGEPGRFANEGPVHTVTIPRPFAIGTFNVTVEEYRAFVEATGHNTSDQCRILQSRDLVTTAGPNWRNPNFWQTDSHPVVCLRWDDVQAYIGWLNQRTGSAVYRLPSEAEWEYAARAGSTTAFHWGDEMTRDRANYGLDALEFETDADGVRSPYFEPRADGADHWEYTSPVDAFPPNPFGLHDMAGNVWQLTQDCWHPDYNGAPQDGSAWISEECPARVARGGSWLKPPIGERSAKRGIVEADDLAGNHEFGFRVARELSGE